MLDDMRAPGRLTALPWLLNLVLVTLLFYSPCKRVERAPVPEDSTHHGTSCSPATAPGAWFSGNKPGSRWQTLNSSCHLTNLLSEYRTNGAHTAPLKILALSDSVDRFLLNFTCSYLGGTYASARPPNDDPHLNRTAYLLHSCRGLSSQLKLGSTYIPGIHPTGPFHNGIIQAYPARIEYAKRKWLEYAGGPPDVVIVASNLWDIARVWGHEPDVLKGQEFTAGTLNQWMLNFTAVVNHVRDVFPEAKAYVYHTTMTPKIDAFTGSAVKPYLGHRNHVAQLNAAGRTVAETLGMPVGPAPFTMLLVVDYAQVAARLYDGQAYLHDLIHLRKDICLELANIYFNLGAAVIQD